MRFVHRDPPASRFGDLQLLPLLQRLFSASNRELHDQDRAVVRAYQEDGILHENTVKILRRYHQYRFYWLHYVVLTYQSTIFQIPVNHWIRRRQLRESLPRVQRSGPEKRRPPPRSIDIDHLGPDLQSQIGVSPEYFEKVLTPLTHSFASAWQVRWPVRGAMEMQKPDVGH